MNLGGNSEQKLTNVTKRSLVVGAEDAVQPHITEPPIGIEPMTYALRVRRSDRLS
jgi:hypothetical protein